MQTLRSMIRQVTKDTDAINGILTTDGKHCVLFCQLFIIACVIHGIHNSRSFCEFNSIIKHENLNESAGTLTVH